MARRAKVNYYPTRGGYFTTFRGKPKKLADGPDDFNSSGQHGPTYLAALKAFSELQQYGASDKAGDANTVRVLCERYAEYLEQHKAPATLTRFKREAAFFVKQYGEQPVGAIKPIHLDDFSHWLKTVRKWKTTRFPMQLIKNAFVWGCKKKLITNNPFEGVQIEDQVTDTKSQVITKETADAFFAKASPYLRDLLLFLWHTGCRPEEAYNLQAKYYDRENKCVVYPGKPQKGDYVWKAAKRTKKDRVIYLDDDMVKLIEEKVKKHPSGYLFRTKMGQIWTRLAVWQQINRVRTNNKITAKITAYGFRHSYITRFLLAGGSIKVLADLCGTSVEMIEKTYSHISDDKQGMRDLMLKTISGSV